MPRSGEGKSRGEKPNLHYKIKVIMESAISESDIIGQAIYSTCQFEKSDVVALEKCRGDSLASPVFKRCDLCLVPFNIWKHLRRLEKGCVSAHVRAEGESRLLSK